MSFFSGDGNRALDALTELAALSNLDRNEGVRRAVLAAEADSRHLKRLELILTANAWAQHNLISPRPYESPPPEEIYGDLSLGSEFYTGERVGLPIGETHVLAAGSTGYGKTNFLRNSCRSLIERGIRFMAIDFLGNLGDLSMSYESVVTIPWERFGENLFNAPENMEQRSWDNIAMEAFCYSYSLMVGSQNFLARSLFDLEELFEQMGNGEKVVLADVGDSIQKRLEKGRLGEKDYAVRVLNRIRALSIETNGMFDHQSGFMKELVQRKDLNVVWDLSGLSEATQCFFTVYLLTYLFFHKLSNPDQRETCVVLLDECAHVFDIGKTYQSQMLNTLIRRARNAGLLLISATQEYSRLSHPLKANCACSLFFRTFEGRDLWEIGKSLSLDASEQEKLRVITQLQPGVAVCRLPQCSKPFLVKTDLFKPSFNRRVMEQNDEMLNELVAMIVPRSNLMERIHTKKDRNDDELRFLQSIVNEPLSGSVERSESLGLSNSRANRIVNILEFKGFIEPVKVKTFRRGGQKVLYEITEKGRKWLSECGVKTNHPLRGSIKHLYYARLIGDYFESMGCEVRFEGRSGNGNADLIIRNGSRSTAVEVELGTDGRYAIGNIAKNLRAGFDGLIIACEEEKMMEKLNREVSRLDREVRSRVSVNMIEDFASRASFQFPPKKKK